MHILSIHNRYLQRGGKEESYELEAQILREQGHQIDVFEENNLRLKQLSSLEAFRKTVWSRETYQNVSYQLVTAGYDIFHGKMIPIF